MVLSKVVSISLPLSKCKDLIELPFDKMIKHIYDASLPCNFRYTVWKELKYIEFNCLSLGEIKMQMNHC